MSATPDGLLHFIQQLTDGWNRHDLELLLSLYAPEYEGVDVARPTPYRGQDGARESLVAYMQAFPDVHFTADDILIQENAVVLVWRAEGTHRGVLMNIPPTHRKVEVKGVSILTICEGKIVRGLYVWDVAGMLRGIGLLPDL